MKKTIAKIMAAAMVLSTVAVPNVQAAADNGRVPYNVYATDATGTNTKTLMSAGANGVADAQTITLSSDDIGSLLSGEELTFGTDLYLTYEAAAYANTGNPINLNLDTNALAAAMTEAGISPGTAKSKTDLINVVNEYLGTSKIVAENQVREDAENLFDASAYDYEKVTTTDGEFNDIVPVANAARWFTPVVIGNRLWVRINPVGRGTTEDIAKFQDWMAKINSTDGLRIGTRLVAINGRQIRVPIIIRGDVMTTDDYWNGFVKLKGDNNTFIPIRVHYEVESGLVNGFANNALYYVNIIGNQNIFGGNITDDAAANQKLAIYNVNSYDLALLQSDVAKGKNLMLDQVYVFTGDQGYLSAWDSWSDTIWLQINNYTNATVGKINTIHARVFKKGKEKLVNVENAKFINNGAFRQNKQLKKVIIGTEVSSVKKINEKAFYDCKKLNTVKVKVNTLKQVGKNAFGGSTDKKGLKFNLKCGNKTQYNKAVKLFKKSGVKKAKFRKI